MGFKFWREQKEKTVYPVGEKELDRAKHVDLIILPDKVTGTNCGNCKYINEDVNFCDHEEIMLPVTSRMCCAYWDHKEVKRPWGEMDL